MAVMALDWNATRVRAVSGPMGGYPLVLPLDPPHVDIPMAISLDGTTPEVGAAALLQCRQNPDVVCRAFLPFLSAMPGHGPRWQAGRHLLDARAACSLIWQKLQPLGTQTKGIVLSLPAYLQAAQAETLCRLSGPLNLPLFGSVSTTLTAALAGHLERFWQRSVLVIDIDDYALTLGWVAAAADKAQLVESRSFPHLGLRFWHDRLINTLADLFVWQHRRDLRDSPVAEQSVYDQLDLLLEAGQQNRAIQLGVKGRDWFNHLLVHPEQTVQFCQTLVNKVAAEVDHLLLTCSADETPRGILLTDQAGRLPGLLEALQGLFQPGRSNPSSLPPDGGAGARLPQSDFHEEDFGEALLFNDTEDNGGVLVLPAEAPARVAHALAQRFGAGERPTGHLETSVPLPAPQPVDAGPPRLHFRGRDYLLREASFLIGSLFGCQLHFEKAAFPEVAAKHCEIVYDHRAFTLFSRSREVTLVNDHPVAGSVVLRAGDRIRLGLRGPVVRVLGRSLPRSAPAVFV